ncbi:hypothetical protein BN873_150079 [Candidatus Competibacter denitrificans Run_A_D11]|uniref:Uncharacterized protein n=1 Tax=Candidatus Competibacter denitrificans Run_A_D11 TaxID=1400863 RepID=W6M1K2_9GAMM|nr:hypothetical protein BN873_150079 [Candidatus Competibacter denitrificans Run_A_D11]
MSARLSQTRHEGRLLPDGAVIPSWWMAGLTTIAGIAIITVMAITMAIGMTVTVIGMKTIRSGMADSLDDLLGHLTNRRVVVLLG